MASWMVHLRIADRLLDSIPDLSPTEFIVGNIAPDSGVPNDDWSVFTPSTRISHFKGTGKITIPPAFAAKYFTPEQQKIYTKEQYSFYLGYLTHLLTDLLWIREVYTPIKERFAPEFDADPRFIRTVKQDFYDLDHKYLRDHPDFRAFSIYDAAVGFRNDFMEEFSSDAFDNRRCYITDYYHAQRENLDREYCYLTETQMDAFVKKATAEILSLLADFQ